MTTKATITYLLNEEGRKKSLLSGGDGKQVQTVEADITPQVLELASVDSNGKVNLQVGYRPEFFRGVGTMIPRAILLDTAVGTRYGGRPYWNETERIHEFPAPQTADSLLTWEQERRERIASRNIELQPEFDRLKAEYEAKQVEEESANAQRKAEREAKEAAKNAERERVEADKLQWIQEHGSDYLKDAVTLGYDCQRQYVDERSEKEFPDFAVDFGDQAEWKSRSCPSREALAEAKNLIAKGYKAEVVWLTCPPWEVDEYERFEADEAVVIRNYLGKYDLVKTV